MQGLRVAVVGCGTAGPAAATMLARAGHDVTVLEAAPDPGPVGAGIWLQDLGQQVVDRLGLLPQLRAASRTVARIDMVSVTGRRLMDLGYRHLPGSVPALGVHRGTLFDLLLGAVRDAGVRLETGVGVTGVRPGPSGAVVRTDRGDLGPFDVVVGADGARSTLRADLRLAVRDAPYAYGALWSVVDDPYEHAGDALYQCVDGTRRYLGVLPTGIGRASVFWSVRTADMARVRAQGLRAWRREAAPFLREHQRELLDGVEDLLEARYRDVVVRTPYRTRGGHGAVLVGDAAHAMSPQLGAGTSLALADVAGLCHALEVSPDVPTALARHAADRRRHVRWYSWWTRAMMPVFQSGVSPLAVPRDLLAGPISSLPPLRTELVRQLCGAQEGLVRRWRLPAP